MDDIVLAFEAITGGKPIAYYDDGKRILFVVDGKNVGKYIGKGGKNVKLLSTALKRDIYIAGYYEDPVQFIKSFYRELDISEIVKEGNKYIVKINDRQQRAMAIGKEGWRINLLNRALKELYNASAEIFQPKGRKPTMITIPTEVKILEETDNLIKVQFKGETHTLFNALKEIAYTINGVKKAAYFIEHPLKDNNYFIIETDGSIKARDALIQALKKLKEELLNFKDWYYSNL